jgi:conjugative transfer signal peptidase TraF
MTVPASIGVGAAAIALLLASVPPHAQRLVWNASASAPIGLYAVTNAKALAYGDLVLAVPPSAAQHLAAERGYLPTGVPLVKYVAALMGDRVCADGLRVTINGREAAIRLPWDSAGRPLPVWRGCKTLDGDAVFLLNGSVLQSFDGRYFGAVSRQNIIGKLRPLWIR